MSGNTISSDLTLTGFILIISFLLPLVSFLICSLVRERYAWTVPLIATFIMMISTCIAATVLVDSWGDPKKLIALPWFSIANNSITANLEFSNISILMFFIVTLISFLVHLYSVGYMAGDMNGKRYFAMLGFFTFSMEGIVLTDSLLVMFVFWELVGFSSYLLIGHDMEQPAAAHSSKKAFIMNRLGDAGFLVGLMMVWTHAGTFNITDLNEIGGENWQLVASVCIFAGVVGKSAQFPLFTWLPDAMTGPTPVSALIHAATMVAAGVFLLARMHHFMSHILPVIAIIGAVTALIGALSALVQNDIKKILAYSTISQLGLMIMAIGLGAIEASLLHLFTHAFFKGCLFLCAGSVILAVHQAQQQSKLHFDAQDIRNLGGLSRKLPVTWLAFITSGASLAGIPFFSGFLSKEAILTSVWGNDYLPLFGIATILTVSFLTILYTFRMIWFTFYGSGKVDGMVRESPVVMQIPMLVLAFGSLWFVVSWNPFDFHGWVIAPSEGRIPLQITMISVLVAAGALLTGWLFFRRTPRSNALLENSFYLDRFYRRAYNKTVVAAASTSVYVDKKLIDRFLHLNAFGQVTLAHVVQWIDTRIIDGSVSAVTRIVAFGGILIRSIQGGKIQLYIFWALFAIIIFLIYALN